MSSRLLNYFGISGCFSGVQRGRGLRNGAAESDRLPLAETGTAAASSSYGGAEAGKSSKVGSVVLSSKRWDWETRGDPWQLLSQAAIAVGQQYAALGIIVLEVFVKFVENAPKRFMTCDSRVDGLALAALCEGTKSCARFFVLLAMVVAAMVAIRMVLRTRIYYEMLRHGAIVNFDNPTPFKDPLFIMLVACIGLAFGHFAMFWVYSWWTEVDSSITFNNMKAAIIFYFAPTAAFMGFLFRSYDTEADLLPLNKYVEEDPVWARSAIADITIVEEDQAIKLVEQGLVPDAEAPLTAIVLYRALIEGASDSIASVENIGHTTPASAFISTMWPAKVLLDSRLRDKDSILFRRVWYIFASMAIPMMVFVLGFFVSQALKDVQDVQEGQIEDSAGLVVEAAYFSATVYLMHHFYLILSIR